MVKLSKLGSGINLNRWLPPQKNEKNIMLGDNLKFFYYQNSFRHTKTDILTLKFLTNGLSQIIRMHQKGVKTRKSV